VRSVLLLMALLTSMGVSCIEVPELAAMSNDTSNDFVLALLGGEPEPSHSLERTPSRACRSTNVSQTSRIPHCPVAIAAIGHSGRDVLSLCLVQRK
jgi:hypothetical protein